MHDSGLALYFKLLYLTRRGTETLIAHLLFLKDTLIAHLLLLKDSIQSKSFTGVSVALVFITEILTLVMCYRGVLWIKRKTGCIRANVILRVIQAALHRDDVCIYILNVGKVLKANCFHIT